MSTLWLDTRFSFRLFARNPGFAAVAVLTLAVALGANTAVFSLMNSILLRALPYRESDRIMAVSVLLPPSESRPSHQELLDSKTIEAWRARSRTVEQLAAYRTGPVTLSGRGVAERLTGARVSSELFPLLRVSPIRGRGLRSEEQQPGRERVVILSDGLWHRRFRRDPSIVGQTVTLDGVRRTIIGVMPASFFFPRREVELWTPLEVEETAAAQGQRGSRTLAAKFDPAIARLREGVTLQKAEAEAQAVLHDSSEAGAAPAELAHGRVLLTPLRDEIVASVRPALLAMFGAVGLVLLMACINLANLLLARSSSRQREMAIRSAVGGSRSRLVRQVLTESALLSLAGASVGVLLAGWLHAILPRILPPDIPRMEEIHLDGRVFFFAVVLSGVTGLLFGLVPAVRSSATDLLQSLRAGVAEGSAGLRSHSALVVAEVALAFVLLVGSGLLLRSFLHRIGVELGYRPDHVLTTTLTLDPAKYGSAGRSTAFFDQLVARVIRLPEVRSAGVVSFPPLASGFSLIGIEVIGQPSAHSRTVPQLSSPGYMAAIGMQLESGRWLTLHDESSQAPVAVVNRAFVHRYVVGARAVGHQIRVGSATLEIVGVLKNVHLLGPDSEPKPELFISYHLAAKLALTDANRLTLAVRAAGEPAALVPILRGLVRELDSDLALEDARPLSSKLTASVAEPRFYALLLGGFAAMALVLAAAGVYGVLTYSVARQTRAIGVRSALGAQRSSILVMILGKGFTLTITGIVIGMAAATGATRVLARLLFGVATGDPVSYAMAALALAGVTFFACYVPARRATRIDPVEALRYD
ncbi:MAG TPA: ABC transporter permease [Thermoanaerobaculia bacterium]|nr:ABC transporter permease [Thermoanaerobaculia bacterium]